MYVKRRLDKRQSRSQLGELNAMAANGGERNDIGVIVGGSQGVFPTKYVAGDLFRMMIG